MTQLPFRETTYPATSQAAAPSGGGEMQSRRTFYGVQVLRGFAALLVVCCHVVPGMFLGNAGVDLFFIISGFVIVWTTQDNWWREHAWRGFLEKRVSRVFPLYWLLTTAKIMVVLAMPYLFRGSQLEPWNTIASYLLIPSLDAEGRISPVMAGGWTLCFEMAFYYLCAASLAMRRRPIVTVAPLFVVLGLLGIFRTPQWGAISSLIDPLLLEFVAGMVIADLARRGIVRGSSLYLVALLLLGVALLVASAQLPNETARSLRVVVWGVPATMIFYAFIGLEAKVHFRKMRLPLLIGDASYSIYLAHALIIPPVAGRVKQLMLPVLGEWAVYVVLIAAGVAGGIVVWWVLERKLIRGMMDLLRPVREAWVNPR